MNPRKEEEVWIKLRHLILNWGKKYHKSLAIDELLAAWLDPRLSNINNYKVRLENKNMCICIKV